jgi:hypothetical protein
MDKFLDSCDQSKLNQEDMQHLSRSIISNKIDAAIKSLSPTLKETPGPSGFTDEFYQNFTGELIQHSSNYP